MKGAFFMKGKIPTEIKVSYIEKYLKGIKNISQICSELSITYNSFYKWLNKYQTDGEAGVAVDNKNRCYSETLKAMAVQDYLAGHGSYVSLCKKYNITDSRVLRNWIKKYNGHEIVKSHNSQGDKTMTTGRTTSYEERIEIVSFCIANNDNYQAAAEKYRVSYQQVYIWVKKYKEKGYDSLLDRRGRRKKTEELTDTEKIAAQLKLLEAENKRLKMENDFLKKLDEVERRREIENHGKKTYI
jgi:Transposase and inactivated derivatives